MAIDTTHTAEEDAQAITEAVLAGRPIDPELAKRIEQRAAAFREEMLREKGLLDIAVPYTRQTREARS